MVFHSPSLAAPLKPLFTSPVELQASGYNVVPLPGVVEALVVRGNLLHVLYIYIYIYIYD
jgi:hypothetical protein